MQTLKTCRHCDTAKNILQLWVGYSMILPMERESAGEICEEELEGLIEPFANGYNLVYKDSEGVEQKRFCALRSGISERQVEGFSHRKVRVKLVSDQWSMGFPTRIAEISAAQDAVETTFQKKKKFGLFRITF